MNTMIMKKISKKGNLALQSLLFLFFVLFCRDIFHLTFNNIYITIFIGVICSLLDKKNMLNFIGALFPLSLGGIQIGYVGLIIAIILLKRIHIRILPALFFIIYVGMEVIHYFSYPASIHVDKSINTVVTYLSLVFICTCLITTKKTKIDVVGFVKYFCYGSAFLCIMSMLNCINIFGLVSVFSGSSRIQSGLIQEETFFETSLMLIANANALAFFSIVGSSCTMALFLKEKLNARLTLFLLALMLVPGLTYVSRTWMMLVMFNFLVFLFYNSGVKKTLGVVAIFVIIFVVSIHFFGNYIDTFYERFADQDFTKGGSRAYIFSYYNSYLLRHIYALFWGVGAVFYSEIVGYDHSIHNGLQQIIVSYGLIGGSFILFFFLSVCFSKIKSFNLILIAPLFTTLFFLQTIQVLIPYSQMLPLVPAVLIMELGLNR